MVQGNASMSEFKGTAGSWLSRCDGELKGRYYYGIFAEDGTEIAYTRSGYYAIENGEANARLIAQAPSLLAALQTLVRGQREGWWGEGSGEFEEGELQLAEAAIAKALGNE